MLYRIQVTPHELKMMRYALEQQINTLNHDIERLSDPRMNNSQSRLIQEFKLYIRDMKSALETLLES